MADAQFGTTRVLRPYPGFDAVYQGRPCNVPLLWSPDGNPLDESSGAPGFAARLARGLTVPLGSRILLWLPIVHYTNLQGTFVPYRWQVCWRLRNLFDYRNHRTQYHNPKQSLGDRSTLPTDLGDRVILTVSNQSVPYQQTEPANYLGPADVNLHDETIRTQAVTSVMLLPVLNAAGDLIALSQGIFDPGAPPSLAYTAETVRSSLFELHEMQAVGDEMILLLSRPYDQAAPWDFTLTDADLLAFLNASRFVGVLAMTGSAP